jgi:hypothetical protein
LFLIIGIINFEPHPFHLAGASVRKFDLYIVATPIFCHSLPTSADCIIRRDRWASRFGNRGLLWVDRLDHTAMLMLASAILLGQRYEYLRPAHRVGGILPPRTPKIHAGKGLSRFNSAASSSIRSGITGHVFPISTDD